MAIDLGDRRTGLAIGDDGTGVITPLPGLELPCGERLRDALLEAVHAHAPDAIVLGLPLNMDGTEGPRARLVRAFGASLAASWDGPIHYQDERLTSFAAEQRLHRTGLTHRLKRRMRDSLAASEILGDFLAAADG